MSKRERKLLDYTRCKRSLDTLKKGDKISSEKLGMAQVGLNSHYMCYIAPSQSYYHVLYCSFAKLLSRVLQEEYSEHKMIYEELNNELCEDLPEFWNRYTFRGVGGGEHYI